MLTYRPVTNRASYLHDGSAGGSSQHLQSPCLAICVYDSSYRLSPPNSLDLTLDLTAQQRPRFKDENVIKTLNVHSPVYKGSIYNPPPRHGPCARRPILVTTPLSAAACMRRQPQRLSQSSPRHTPAAAQPPGTVPVHSICVCASAGPPTSTAPAPSTHPSLPA